MKNRAARDLGLGSVGQYLRGVDNHPRLLLYHVGYFSYVLKTSLTVISSNGTIVFSQ